jgi:hypothetical protein
MKDYNKILTMEFKFKKAIINIGSYWRYFPGYLSLFQWEYDFIVDRHCLDIELLNFYISFQIKTDAH